MNPVRTRGNRKGFTLVELLVVVLILAILMAVALPLYLGAIANSERATARANMQTIANANQAYRLSTGAFAADITALLSGGDLTAVAGPGTRTYNLVSSGSCDHDANGSTADQAIPSGSFAVTSSETSDGCFIPGVSTR